jgi:hypothetical protein
MTEQEYMTTRVDDQIAWYDKKSGINQAAYKRIRLTQIILAATLPFATAYISEEFWQLKLVVGIMGITIAILEGVQTLYKYQDNWVEYRKSREALMREKLLFQTQSGLYSDEKTAFKTFVSRIENFTEQENNSWLKYIKQQEEKKA